MESGLTQVDKPVPFPSITDENKDHHAPEIVDARSRGKGESTSTGHKRGLSGSILSKISLLRSNSGGDKAALHGGTDSDETRSGSGSAMAGAQQSVKQRKRKGSLRKTALLGKGRDRKGSDMKEKAKSPLSSPRSPDEDEKESPLSLQPQEVNRDADITPRPSCELESPVSPVSPPRWPLFSRSRVSLASIRSSVPSVEPASSAASITSPTLPTDASTTDDDEQIAFPRIPSIAPRKPPSSSGDSYFPPQNQVQNQNLLLMRHGNSTNRTKSPLATQPTSLTNSPAPSEGLDSEWDYSETAFWGYVILIITWLVFVVGIGSCFDVWSWAWDVGEKPETLPELEDDPTLPIVGYYPALLVLTCVMAWVWVVVAWVGMKYFRHADLRDGG
jgi:Phosphatidylinositol N-acetylglucosaminyltransferase subunit Y